MDVPDSDMGSDTDGAADDGPDDASPAATRDEEPELNGQHSGAGSCGSDDHSGDSSSTDDNSEGSKPSGSDGGDERGASGGDVSGQPSNNLAAGAHGAHLCMRICMLYSRNRPNVA